MGVVSSLSFNICSVEAPCSVISSDRAVVAGWGGVGAISTCLLSHTKPQASRSPHLIMLVLTWEKAPSVFAADLFEGAHAYLETTL